MSRVIFTKRWSMSTLTGAAIYGTTRQMDPRTPAHGGVFFLVVFFLRSFTFTLYGRGTSSELAL